jgi:putative phosphoribosyl transferase
MEAQLSKHSVQVTLEGNIWLEGTLHLPAYAQGIVLFAHGSASSRHGPRNLFIADRLNKANLATLLIDLLTAEEEELDNRTHHLRFDIDLLADRLTGTIDWLTTDDKTRPLTMGLFGASTGAGAALVAAAKRSSRVSAVVSRGGRPDLAGDFLEKVQAPTLLIVGENDPAVLKLNREAMEKLSIPNLLEIVPRASHLFEEAGTLELVADLAQKWFTKYLNQIGS